jgi:hypothetical protein
MNERILELALQAGCLNDPNRHLFLLGEDHLEWFAELIVQECSRQVMSTVLLEGDDGSAAEVLIHASFQLKQHFGVEL